MLNGFKSVFIVVAAAFLGGCQAEYGNTESLSSDDALTQEQPLVPGGSATVPILVGATALATDSVQLEWLPVGGKIHQTTEYKVYATPLDKAGAVAGSTLGIAPVVGADNVTVNDLAPGTDYLFEIEAVNASGSTTSLPLQTRTWSRDAKLSGANKVHVASTGVQKRGKVTPKASLSFPDDIKIGDIVFDEQGLIGPRRVTGHPQLKRSSDGVLGEMVAINEIYENFELSAAFRLSDPGASSLQKRSGGLRTNSRTWQKSGLQLHAQGPSEDPNVARKASIVGSNQVIEENGVTLTAPLSLSVKPGVGINNVHLLNAVAVNHDPWGFGNYQDMRVCRVQAVSFTNNNTSAMELPSLRFGAAGVFFVGETFSFPDNLINADISISWNPGLNDASDSGAPWELELEVTTQDGSCSSGEHADTASVIVPIYVEAGDLGSPVSDTSVHGEVGLQVTNTVAFNYDPQIRTQMEVSNFQLQTALLEARSDVLMKQTLEIETTASGEVLIEKELATKSFVKFFSVGGVPVVIGGTMTLSLEGSVTMTGAMQVTETFDFGFEDDGRGLQFGLQYDRNSAPRWQPIKHLAPTASLTIEGDAGVRADIDLRLVPQIEIRFYEAAIGSLTVKPGVIGAAEIEGAASLSLSTDAGLIIDPPHYRFNALEAGLDVDAYLYAGLEVFGNSIANYPAGAVLDNIDTHKHYELLRLLGWQKSDEAWTPILKLPEITPVTITPIAHPSDSRSILVETGYENHVNPINGVHSWPFTQFGKAEVVLPGTQSLAPGHTTLVDGGNDLDGRRWLFYQGEGQYTVRQYAYSAPGDWAQQYVEGVVDTSDNDGDGIADLWEQVHRAGQPNADPDNDGRTNLQEYQDGTFPHRPQLVGGGSGPQLYLRDASQASFSLRPDSAPTQRSLLVENIGLQTAVIASVGVTGSGAASFGLVEHTCVTSLLPGQSCSVTVSITPNQAGQTSGTLSVNLVSGSAGALNATLLADISEFQTNVTASSDVKQRLHNRFFVGYTRPNNGNTYSQTLIVARANATPNWQPQDGQTYTDGEQGDNTVGVESSISSAGVDVAAPIPGTRWQYQLWHRYHDGTEYRYTAGTGGYAYTALGGAISTDLTLDEAGSPYLMGSVTVANGGSLTIPPSVVIKLSGSIIVNSGATLNASGVLFTSDHDDDYGDTNGDSTSTTPAAGDWSQIKYKPGSSGVLDGVIVRYGGSSNKAQIEIDSSDVSLLNSDIYNGQSHGVEINNAGPLVDSNTLSNNGGDGLQANSITSTAVITNNGASGNGGRQITFNGSIPTNAEIDHPAGQVHWLPSTVAGHLVIDAGIVRGATTVVAGGTLELGSGVIAKLNSRIVVNSGGALLANGTVFTSPKDDTQGGDTNGDGDATTPAVDDWQRVVFLDGSSGVLDGVTVRYGGNSYTWCVSNTNIACYGAVSIVSDDVQVKDSTIESNGRYGVHIINASPSIRGNSFSGNTINDLRAESPGSGFVLADNTTASHSGSNYGLNLTGNIGNVTQLDNPNADFAISGDIVGDVNLPRGLLRGGFTVVDGGTLELGSGVIAKLNSRIVVNSGGALLASGTVFTSPKDDTQGGDTNGDGDATTPAVDDWQRVVFLDGSSGVLDGVTVRYGGNSYTWCVSNTNIACYGAVSIVSDDVQVKDSTIESNGRYGVHIINASPSIRGNSFSGNTINDLRAESPGSGFVLVDNTTASHSGFNYGLNLTGNIGNVTQLDNPNADFAISGDIVGDVNLPRGLLRGGFTVVDGGTLELGSGVIAKLNSRIVVNSGGALLANGTVFTSPKDDTQGGDTNGDGDATTPAVDDWQRVVFLDGSSGVLDGVTVRYGGNSYTWCVSNTNIACYGAVSIVSDDVQVKDSTIESNGRYGVHIINASPSIRGNSFSGNTINDLRAESPGSGFVLADNTTASHSGSNYGLNLTGNIGNVTQLDNPNADFAISGDIVGDVNLPRGLLRGGFTVVDGGTLELGSGVIAKLNSRIVVNSGGALLANGTVFTSPKDDTQGGDTNGDGDATTPAVDDWQRVVFLDGSSGVLDGVTVRYGGNSYTWCVSNTNIACYGAVSIVSDDVQVKDSTIESNGRYGVHIINASPTVVNSIIKLNQTGIYSSGPGLTAARNNQFVSNTSYAAYAANESTIDAINSWWGDASGPYHSTDNTGGLGGSVLGNVLYTPWATDTSGTLDFDNDGIPDSEDPDDDNDGMTDVWELENGLNHKDASDATLDGDGDGRSNLREFLDGTDPQTPDTPVPSLPVNALSSTLFGHNVPGGVEIGNAITVNFVLNGPAWLHVQGYDINDADEVCLVLNNVTIGCVKPDGSEQATGDQLFWLGDDLLAASTQQLVIEQKTSGETWGVTRLGLLPVNAELGLIDDNQLYQHQDGFDLYLPANSDYLLPLTAWDADSDDEIRIKTGNITLGELAASNDEAWGERHHLLLPESSTAGWLNIENVVGVNELWAVRLGVPLANTTRFGQGGSAHDVTIASGTLRLLQPDSLLSKKGYQLHDIDSQGEVDLLIGSAQQMANVQNTDNNSWGVITTIETTETGLIPLQFSANDQSNTDGWALRWQDLPEDVPMLVSPVDGTTLTDTEVTFSWSGTNVSNWWLYLGTTPRALDVFNSGSLGSADSVTVAGLPDDGSAIHATLWYRQDAVWQTYTANFTALDNLAGPSILIPANSAVLDGSTQVFSWAGNNVTDWWLYLGSYAGSRDFYDSGSLGSATTVSVMNLPTDGSAIFATLWYKINGIWASVASGYTAGSQIIEPAINSPTDGDTLPGESVTFEWSGNQITEWWLYLGNAAGGQDIYNSGNLGNTTSVTVNDLPITGSTLHATLWYKRDGTWQSVRSSYITFVDSTPMVVSPLAGATLEHSTQTFLWTGTQISSWWLYLGSSAGSSDLFDSGNLGSSTSISVVDLPIDGSSIHATLWYKTDGAWESVASSYTSSGGAAPTIKSPVAGTTLGVTQTFSWSGADVTGWWLYLGTQPGQSDVFDSGNLGTGTTATVSGLPVDGSTVYATLWFHLNGNWQSVKSSYSSTSE